MPTAVRTVQRHLGRMPTWLPVLVGMAIAASLAPAPAAETAIFVVTNLLSTSPIILAAAALAGYAHASGADRFIANVFVGHTARMIMLATLFGTVTPLCGISVLPIMLGLLRAGVPLAPVMAFWLSSPVTKAGALFHAVFHPRRLSLLT